MPTLSVSSCRNCGSVFCNQLSGTLSVSSFCVEDTSFVVLWFSVSEVLIVFLVWFLETGY